MSEFEEITAEFLPMFEDVKGLAEELRDILFGTRRLFTGTYKEREDLDRIYDGMINAFEKMIGVYGHLSKRLLYKRYVFLIGRLRYPLR